MKLVLATGNKGKVREIKALCAEFDVTAYSELIEPFEVIEDGDTFKANALIKANKRFDFMLFPGQRHGFGRMTEYSFWLRADHFSKYFLGVEASNVDIIEMNRDKAKK